MGWDLHIATPVDFLKLYMGMGIVFTSDRAPQSANSALSSTPQAKTIGYVKKYCEFFVELCQQEYEF